MISEENINEWRSAHDITAIQYWLNSTAAPQKAFQENGIKTEEECETYNQ